MGGELVLIGRNEVKVSHLQFAGDAVFFLSKEVKFEKLVETI